MKRTGLILNKKYLLYMIPAFLSAVGISLSEFVDSLVVSHLLDENAMGIITLAMPAIMICSTIYTIFGYGGSLLFAEFLGSKDHKKAKNTFSLSIMVSFLVSLFFSVLGICTLDKLGPLFGCSEELLYGFNRHITILLYAVPIICLTISITFYLPIIGKPWAASLSIITANILNIAFDFIYIRLLGMDIAGAALATLTGYAVALTIALYFVVKAKNDLAFKLAWPNLKSIGKIAKKGMSSGTIQICYAVLPIFCNNLMNFYYETAGIVFFALCIQLDSITSIMIAGIADNLASFNSMLKGEEDYHGIRILTKNVATWLFSAITMLAIIFCVFPNKIAHIFNIQNPETLLLVKTLLPIYVLHYPLRVLCIVLRNVYNVLGREWYAIVTGIIDKYAGIALFGLVLSSLFEGKGVIWAFPVNSFSLFLLILAVNSIIYKISNGRYSRILLLDKTLESGLLYDLTFMPKRDDITEVSSNIQNILQRTEERSLVSNAKRFLEEIIPDLQNHNPTSPIDIHIIKKEKSICVNFRNSGISYNPYAQDKISNVEYSYAFGLNSIRITLGGQK